ncbi:hypothetical protein C8Q78DRAFT_994777 [Trametes maxima]|nr:hypothetical protein C8Q78DRAFT_994777 [Trametes maxima]
MGTAPAAPRALQSLRTCTSASDRRTSQKFLTRKFRHGDSVYPPASDASAKTVDGTTVGPVSVTVDRRRPVDHSKGTGGSLEPSGALLVCDDILRPIAAFALFRRKPGYEFRAADGARLRALSNISGLPNQGPNLNAFRLGIWSQAAVTFMPPKLWSCITDEDIRLYHGRHGGQPRVV